MAKKTSFNYTPSEKPVITEAAALSVRDLRAATADGLPEELNLAEELSIAQTMFHNMFDRIEDTFGVGNDELSKRELSRTLLNFGGSLMLRGYKLGLEHSDYEGEL